MERITYLKSRPSKDRVRIGFRLFWATSLVLSLLFGGQVWGQLRIEKSIPGSGPVQNDPKPKPKAVRPDTEHPISDSQESLVPERVEKEESAQVTVVTDPVKPKKKIKEIGKKYGVKPHVIAKGRQKRGLPKAEDDPGENNYSLQIPLNSPTLQHSFLSQEDSRFMNQEEESFEDETDLKDDYYEEAKRQHHLKGKKGKFFDEQISSRDDSEDDADQAVLSK